MALVLGYWSPPLLEQALQLAQQRGRDFRDFKLGQFQLWYLVVSLKALAFVAGSLILCFAERGSSLAAVKVNRCNMPHVT
jgi:hypothetical protein